MTQIFQISALFLMFIGSIAKTIIENHINNFSKRNRFILWSLYWVVMTGILISGVVEQIIVYKHQEYTKQQNEMRREADVVFREGTKWFDLGINSSNISQLENAIPHLQKAAELYHQIKGEKFNETSATAGIAFLREKIAHFGAKTGKVYKVQNQQIIQWNVEEGDTLDDKVDDDKQHSIRCTDINNSDSWGQASNYYNSSLELLKKINTDQYSSYSAYKSGLISAARNSGYFFLCDYLRKNDDKSKYLAKEAFELAYLIAKEKQLEYRMKDLKEKLNFVEVLEKNPNIKQKNSKKKE